MSESEKYKIKKREREKKLSSKLLIPAFVPWKIHWQIWQNSRTNAFSMRAGILYFRTIRFNNLLFYFSSGFLQLSLFFYFYSQISSCLSSTYRFILKFLHSDFFWLLLIFLLRFWQSVFLCAISGSLILYYYFFLALFLNFFLSNFPLQLFPFV